MNNNLLLMYLSELGHGNWSHFRQGLEYLADDEDDLYRSVKARQLSMLGHVEFAFEGDLRWAVCPPTIAWQTHTNQLTGVLCGGRSLHLLDTLTHLCWELDCELEQIPQAEGPDVVLITVPSNDVGEYLAQQSGLRSQPDAAECLIEILPELCEYVDLCPHKPTPRGYKTERYDVDCLRWIEIADDARHGLYRYTHYSREYRLKLNDVSLRTPPYIGIFAWLQHEKQVIFHYDPDNQTLASPVSAILPPLFGRAVVLCSGFLPRFEVQAYQHVYREVSPSVAYHLLHKLHQEVHE